MHTRACQNFVKMCTLPNAFISFLSTTNPCLSGYLFCLYFSSINFVCGHDLSAPTEIFCLDGYVLFLSHKLHINNAYRCHFTMRFIWGIFIETECAHKRVSFGTTKRDNNSSLMCYFITLIIYPINRGLEVYSVN